MVESKPPSQPAVSQQSDPLVGRVAVPRPTVDSPEAQGAAIGVLGVAGGLAWRERRRTIDAAALVSPVTRRGTINVIAWLAGLIALASVCDLVLPGPPALWGFVALGVMVLVALWWGRRGST